MHILVLDEIIVDTETISYTSKSEGRFSGLTRGVNFNYDQRVVLDTGQNTPEGVSTYQYNVGDRVVRRVDNANNKVAKVYDWNPNSRELLVTFEVDELPLLMQVFLLLKMLLFSLMLVLLLVLTVHINHTLLKQKLVQLLHY